jgi:light-regulated signal transduction histidine kinase (bacteriophytochrome)
VLLKRVIFHLLGNAFKYTRTRPRAQIRAEGRGDGRELLYTVRDNGVGFDMRHADKLFGVFQRLHGSSEFEGTGVGLALVQRIVVRHGGRVWAEGTSGGGATFGFSLPQREDHGRA